MINGSTKIVGLIGHPVEHSFSPPMHNAAFEELGLDYAYVPFNVCPENLKYHGHSAVPHIRKRWLRHRRPIRHS